MRKAKMEQKRVIIANITWNDSGWRNIYVNPRAGHEYARKYPGHECLNFEFNKKGIDDGDHVYGFIQWTADPKYLAKGGIIIFYSRNLETYRGEIVGIYGNAKVLEKEKRTKWKGFQKNEIVSNIVAEKNYSLLFPIPLDSAKYSKGKRLVPQVGYTYKDIDVAEKIVRDEIVSLQKAGIRIEEYKKLRNIFKLITGKDYSQIVTSDESSDLKEQDELVSVVKKEQNREQIIQELKEVTPGSPELVEVKGKQYKRNNKIIAQLKILRGFKCQICETRILKKDDEFYVEASHILEKRHKGTEMPENILILCPNHHKEFDLGKRNIMEKTKDKIVFQLNGKEYSIDLDIK
jgi:hypothetical protein